MRTQKLTEAWFPIEDDPDETEFRIKHLRSGESKKIEAATQKRRFEFRKEIVVVEGTDETKEKLVPVPILDIDPIEEKELSILESITGWKNVLDSDGEPLLYSKTNKAKFSKELSIDDYAAFLLFVDKCRKTLAKTVAEQEKAVLGN